MRIHTSICLVDKMRPRRGLMDRCGGFINLCRRLAGYRRSPVFCMRRYGIMENSRFENIFLKRFLGTPSFGAKDEILCRNEKEWRKKRIFIR